MSLKLLQMVWNTECNLLPGEHHVLMCLAYCANDSNNMLCFPSIKTIAKKCHMSRPNVFRILKSLSDAKIIKKINRIDNDGTQRSNIYELNEDLLSGKELILWGYQDDTPPSHHATPPVSI